MRDAERNDTAVLYTATCAPDAITVVEKNPHLVAPMTLQITRSGDVLSAASTIQGSTQSLGHFKKSN